MGQADYGVFATVWVWTIMLGHASLWGMGQSTCRFLPAYRARRELGLARGFLAGGAAFTLASGFVTAGVGGVPPLWAPPAPRAGFWGALAPPPPVLPPLPPPGYARGGPPPLHL